MRQTMTLLDMILERGLDPFKDKELLTFINEYWTYDYNIDAKVLTQLKLMFVNTYMYREIQFPEASFASALSPKMQWKLVLSRYLHEQEDWYVSLYNKMVKLDPLAFTTMVTISNGASGGTVNNENKLVNTATQRSTVANDATLDSSSKSVNTSTQKSTDANESTTDSTNKGNVSASSTDHTASVSDTNSTSNGKTTGTQANGIGTIDGGFDPVSVTAGNVVVADSNMNGSTKTDTSNEHNSGSTDSTESSKTTSDDTGSTKSKGSSTSSGTTDSSTTNTGNSKSKGTTTSNGNTDASATNTGTTKSAATTENTTTTKGAVANKLELNLKYINAFRNINKEFVDNAWMLFQSTFI